MVKFLIIILSTLLLNNAALSKLSEAEEVFLKKVFKNNIPEKKRLILKGENKDKVKVIMGNKYKKRLFSYWADENNQAWILNSIGKYKPITAGFIVNNCKIKSSHVIKYREQHGYEIKFPAFLLQFTNGKINSNMKLDVKIDNISGATLSVNSMQRMARTALLLNKLSNEDTCT
tara:strand:- start:249 stop:770 length:522 start_codon:yes stop_codon:yes gene_type:complete